MKRLSIAFLLLVFNISVFAQEKGTEQLQYYLRTSHKKDIFNGTALVVHKGKVLLHYAQGIRNISQQSLNDTATIYRIGSLSKPFTALVILQLQEKGLLSIHDKVSKYLPDFPRGDSITLEQLLTHSSHVKEYLEVPAIQKTPDSAPPIEIDSLISLFKDGYEPFRRGQKFRYSNSNYILLARIAEKITGKKFEHIVREQLFEPAGMAHSGFDFKHVTDTAKATGYLIQKKGLAAVEDFDSTYAPGCGSMYSTTMDLYHAYRALMQNKWVLSATRDSSFIPRKWIYGYGWFSYKLYGKQCVSHPGGVPGFYSHMQFFPEEDLFVVILSNTGPTRITTDKIAGIVLGKKTQYSGL